MTPIATYIRYVFGYMTFLIQRTLYIMTIFLPRSLAILKNLLLHRIQVRSGMTGLFYLSQNIWCGYLLELPWQGNSNKYPQHMFLGALTTTFLNIPYFLFNLEVVICCLQIVTVTSFVYTAKAHIRRDDCMLRVWNILEVSADCSYCSLQMPVYIRQGGNVQCV